MLFLNLWKNIFDWKSPSLSNKKVSPRGRQQKQTDIATDRLNRPRGQFSERSRAVDNGLIKKQASIPTKELGTIVFIKVFEEFAVNLMGSGVVREYFLNQYEAILVNYRTKSCYVLIIELSCP